MSRKLFLLTGTILTLAAAPFFTPHPQAATGQTLYVTPNGNDNNPGTFEQPLQTLTAVRNKIRQIKQTSGLTNPITVYLRGGIYYLEKPIRFDERDSGSKNFEINYRNYPGETPILSGGREITNWQNVRGHFWETQLDDVKEGKWWFRQLFRGESRLTRARFPNSGNYIEVVDTNSDNTEITFKKTPAIPGQGDLGKTSEAIIYQDWDISRSLILDKTGQTVRLSTTSGWGPHCCLETKPGRRAHLEHAREFIDQPDEWYLDKNTGKLTILLANGEDPNVHKFTAPVAKQLLVVKGQPDRVVSNLTFTGLNFEYTGWKLPDTGYNGIQSGHYGTTVDDPTFVLPLAIQIEYVDNFSLRDCSIAHIGANAVGFGAGVSNSKIDNCQISDIGANGIMVGWRGSELRSPWRFAGDWDNYSHNIPKVKKIPRNNSITNNRISKTGRISYGTVGIWEAYSENTTIAHNEVEDSPHSGISIGFAWGPGETSQQGHQDTI